MPPLRARGLNRWPTAPSAARCHAACILRAVPSSEALTRGVRVVVNARYSSSHSDPAKREWFFLYTVTITNLGEDTVQLVNRHWVIMNANGHVEEVRGPGVVGNQPTLKSGESFEYTSGCPLKTPFGSMHGDYEMVTAGGEAFLAEIAPFALRESETFH
jgi:ApaG protein